MSNRIIPASRCHIGPDGIMEPFFVADPEVLRIAYSFEHQFGELAYPAFPVSSSAVSRTLFPGADG